VLGIVIADLNQIADLKLSILVPVNSDCRSESNTVPGQNPVSHQAIQLTVMHQSHVTDRLSHMTCDEQPSDRQTVTYDM